MKSQTTKSLNSLPQLRGISIRQPFAEQILRGEKPIEYRTKPTNIRERVYIYASLGSRPAEDWEDAGIAPDSLPVGVVVGTVQIVDCKASQTFDGEYDWHLARPERLASFAPPLEHPQPIWFYPFGRPSHESIATKIDPITQFGSAMPKRRRKIRRRKKSH